MAERTALESEIIRKCLSRSELQCSFLEYRGYKVIYRRYASLFFIVGTKPSVDEEENQENELGMLEFIHTLVETMDRWAGSICELDIMYSVSTGIEFQVSMLSFGSNQVLIHHSLSKFISSWMKWS